MNNKEKIEKIVYNNFESYYDFLRLISNCKDVSYYYRDPRNFGRKRTLFLGENVYKDIYLISDDIEYIKEYVRQEPDADIFSLYYNKEFDNNLFTDNWSIYRNYTFYKKTPNSGAAAENCIRLTSEHKELVEATSIDRLHDYYGLDINYNDELYENYAIVLDNKIISYLAVGKYTTLGIKNAEICWIFTQPAFRQRNYAQQLLNFVCNILINKGYMVTYHCDSENIASMNTALKAKMIKSAEQIILQKK